MKKNKKPDLVHCMHLCVAQICLDGGGCPHGREPTYGELIERVLARHDERGDG